ncbi:MAG TPA: hypothetical protein VLB75_09915 [Steroidobacteraceae bacterium]|nr:hypothetical protein [Steroidobacteraceae bacterium]
MNTRTQMNSASDRRRARAIATVGRATLCCALAALTVVSAHATPREQAKRIHERLTGIAPTDSVLSTMEASVAGGNPAAAAMTAMTAPTFYTVTLKNFVTPWTNRDQTVFAPLNDYTATVIGMVRDDVPFNTVLSADIIYTGRGGLAGVPAYSPANNDHFAALESQNVNLASTTDFVRQTQSALTGIPAAATAGIITTRAAAEAFFIAGTNRAMFRFTLMNHLCRDMEQVLDTSRPPDRIRQDVSRSPGGDARIFLNNCIGCHSGMDPMAQAFAFYTYDEAQGRILYTAGAVQPKYFNNDTTFPFGFVTPNENWENRWRAGQNALLGWSPSLPGSGSGAKSLGDELAGSDAFAQCHVEKVFRNVCFRAPVDAADRAQVSSMVSSFRSSGFRLKQVFAEAAAYCMGD